MLSGLLFTKNNNIIEKGLDAAWLRNNVISQNIANVDTPGYKRKVVLFEEYLDNELNSSRISQGKTRLSSNGMQIIEDPASSSYRSDGNNVDIEHEMALMAANNIRYNTLIQRINGDFQKLKTVIRGGR